MELSKYIKGEQTQLMRSQIRLADYNPRVLTAEAKKRIKRGIKRYGMVDSFIVNKQTGYTLVGGHQRLQIIDELEKYDPSDPDSDYAVPVMLIDVDEKQEKELNILLNNTSAQGEFDWEALRQIIPTIDYNEIGFSDADLSFIGIDYTVQTENESAMADALADMYAPAQEAHNAEVQQRKEQRVVEREAQRQAIQEAQKEATAQQEEMSEEDKWQAKIDHMKDVKAQVKKEAAEKASNMQAYVTLSFTTWENKARFMERFGYNVDMMFVKGEEFDEKCEVVMEEDYEDDF